GRFMFSATDFCTLACPWMALALAVMGVIVVRLQRTRNAQMQSPQLATRDEAIAALRQAEAKYRDIFENAVEGIFQTTPDGRYLSANRALARMYGFDSPAELMASIGDIERSLYLDPRRRGD